MRPLWLEHSEEFYLKLFAYLKKKFPYKIKAFQLIGQHIPSEISESANQISQKQADFQDAPEESLESNQENEFTQINTPELLSDKNHTVLIKDNKQIRARAKVIHVTTKKKHTVLIKENKQIGVQARAQVIHVLTKKKHIFVKPNPDQLASEERAKEKNKDT